MTGSGWIILLTLWNYESGPVEVDPLTCWQIQGRVAAGMMVIAERNDGTVIPIRRARCIRPRIIS